MLCISLVLCVVQCPCPVHTVCACASVFQRIYIYRRLSTLCQEPSCGSVRVYSCHFVERSFAAVVAYALYRIKDGIKSCSMLKPYARTNAYFSSFVPSSVSLWNNLPYDALTADSIRSF